MDSPRWRGVRCPNCGSFVTRIDWTHTPRCWECSSCMMRWRQGIVVEGVEIVQQPWYTQEEMA